MIASHTIVINLYSGQKAVHYTLKGTANAPAVEALETEHRTTSFFLYRSFAPSPAASARWAKNVLIQN